MPATCARDPRSAPADASEALTAFPWKERQEMNGGRPEGRKGERTSGADVSGKLSVERSSGAPIHFPMAGPIHVRMSLVILGEGGGRRSKVG